MGQPSGSARRESFGKVLLADGETDHTAFCFDGFSDDCGTEAVESLFSFAGECSFCLLQKHRALLLKHDFWFEAVEENLAQTRLLVRLTHIFGEETGPPLAALTRVYKRVSNVVVC